MLNEIVTHVVGSGGAGLEQQRALQDDVARLLVDREARLGRLVRNDLVPNHVVRRLQLSHICASNVLPSTAVFSPSPSPVHEICF